MGQQNIEVKHQIGINSKGCLNGIIWGRYNQFLKWSFSVKQNDFQSNKIFKGSCDNWIAVDKERMLAQIFQRNGSISISSTAVQVENGCQIEFSTPKIRNKKW